MNKIITLPSTPLLIEDLGVMPTPSGKENRRYGLYKCQCGNEFKALSGKVRIGDIKSCGCYRKECSLYGSITHGLYHHRLYTTWNNMIKRCTNNKNKSFKDYGRRGIAICESWLNIENFINDMYPTYQDGLSIDRIDVNGNYEPSNCRWASTTTQARNTRVLKNNNTSGYRGVHFNNRDNRWVARISISSIRKCLGYFDTALDAAKAYDKYVIDNNLEHTINSVL